MPQTAGTRTWAAANDGELSTDFHLGFGSIPANRAARDKAKQAERHFKRQVYGSFW